MSVMSGGRAERKRATNSVATGRVRSAKALAAAGEQIAAARRRRGWSQEELARKLGYTQARQSQIEAGKAAGMPTDLWFALADALGMPFRFELGRDPLKELEDSGHLEMQEFMLGLGRRTGRQGTFELQTRPFP